MNLQRRIGQASTLARLTLLSLLGTVVASSASAQTVTVDTAADVIDIDWTSATVADLPGPDGKISFAEAMIATNNTPGHQTVHFAIPQNEWILQFLYPGRAVVMASSNQFFFRSNDDVTVDGRSQTAFTGDTNPDGGEVVITGAEYYLNGPNSSIYGCDSTSINLTGANGLVSENTLCNISLFQGGNTLIDGNTGGTIKIDRSNGNLVTGNTFQRIRIWGGGATSFAVGNQVGGPTLAERNLFTGYGTINSEGLPAGATVQLFHTQDTQLENNWIGLAEDGLSQGSQASTMGIEFSGENVDTLVLNNRIAGILGHGTGPHHAGQLFGWAVILGGGGSGVRLFGNKIGLDVNDQPLLGSVWGVDFGHSVFSTMTDLQVGGTGPGEANVIAGHILNGVTVGRNVGGARISANSIFENGWLGIDLAETAVTPTGPTANDPLDTDTGGNGLQNYPVIASASAAGSSLTILGDLDTSASEAFDLEFFASAACDGSGFGEGTLYLGTQQVVTDAGGHASFSATLGATVPSGWVVAATATRVATDDTSEFSACVPIDGSLGTNYCTAATNSTGSGAVISAAGSLSIATNSLTLGCAPLPNQPGLFFYGPNQITAPFGDGFRCVGGSTTRLNPVVFVSGGQANRVVDLALQGFTAGQSVNFQFWYRDPAAGGTGFNLSNGLAVTFAP